MKKFKFLVLPLILVFLFVTPTFADFIDSQFRNFCDVDCSFYPVSIATLNLSDGATVAGYTKGYSGAYVRLGLPAGTGGIQNQYIDWKAETLVSSNGTYPSVEKLTDYTCAVFYKESPNAYVKIGTVSGTAPDLVLTLGSANSAGNTFSDDCVFKAISSTTVAILYISSGKAYVKFGEVSGDSVTFGSSYELGSYNNVFDIDTTSSGILCASVGNSNGLYLLPFHATGGVVDGIGTAVNYLGYNDATKIERIDDTRIFVGTSSFGLIATITGINSCTLGQVANLSYPFPTYNLKDVIVMTDGVVYKAFTVQTSYHSIYNNVALLEGSGTTATVTWEETRELKRNYTVRQADLYPLLLAQGQGYYYGIFTEAFGEYDENSGAGDGVGHFVLQWSFPAPEITAIDPNSADIGSTVTVNTTGNNFRDGCHAHLQRNNWLNTIDATTTTYVDANHAQATFEIPNDTSYAGTWSLVLANKDWKYASTNFTIVIAPVVQSINPTSGLRGQTITGTVQGQNFLPETQVRLQKDTYTINITTTYKSNTELGIQFTIPFDAILGKYDVVVSQSSVERKLSEGFEVKPQPAPKINSIDPNSGKRGQSVSAQIKGSDFTPNISGVLRKGSNEIPMTLTYVNQNQVNANFTISSDAEVGKYDVVLLNQGGIQEGVLSEGFSVLYQYPLVISTVSANCAKQSDVVNLTIIGNGFENGVTVYITKGSERINGSNVLLDGNTTINVTFNIPSDSFVGNCTLVVENIDGQKGTTSFLITYLDSPPTVSTAEPNNFFNDKDQVITIKGSGFHSGLKSYLTKNEKVIEGQIESVKSDEVKAKFNIKYTENGDYILTVENDDTTKDTSQISIANTLPKLNSVSPQTGAIGKSMNISIEGDYFFDGIEAWLQYSGDKLWKIPVTVIDKTYTKMEVEADIPADIPKNKQWQLHSKNVGNSDETIMDNAVYLETSVLKIESVSPGESENGKVIALEIKGSGFTNETSVRIYKGSKEISISDLQIVDSDTITCKADLRGVNPSYYNVEVKDSDMEDSLFGGFRVYSGSSVDKPVNPSSEEPSDDIPDCQLQASYKWYFGEGSTNWGFETYFVVENPNDKTTTVGVTYYTPKGRVDREDIKMAPHSRVIFNPVNDLGKEDFSTYIHSKEKLCIYASRTQMWNGEAASSIGSSVLAKHWYFAEGCTTYGYETWVLIQNPNKKEAHITIHYTTENPVRFSGTDDKIVQKVIPSETRVTYNVADDFPGKNVTIKIFSDLPVVAERAMYKDERNIGHAQIGVVNPSKTWYVPEGCTGEGFEEWLLLANTQNDVATVNMEFMTRDTYESEQPTRIAPYARVSIPVKSYIPNSDVSARITSDVPIIVERSMYWSEGGHSSSGYSVKHSFYYLPDASSKGKSTWILVQNPNNKDVKIGIFALKVGGGYEKITDTLPPNTRRTYNMLSITEEGDYSVIVQPSDGAYPVFAEISSYWGEGNYGVATVGGVGE